MKLYLLHKCWLDTVISRGDTLYMFGVAADAEVGDVGPGPRVALTAAAAGRQGVADTSSSTAGAAAIEYW